MEKNITGTNPSPDRDDMELKRRLDAAFELDTLTVSEDLIQRTLLKIKEMDNTVTELQEAVTEKHRRRYPARRFVGAAAAVLLLVTAVWAYQNNLNLNKLDTGTALNEKTNINMQAVPNPESSLASDSAQGKKEVKIAAAEESSNAGGSDTTNSDTANNDASKSITFSAAAADTEQSLIGTKALSLSQSYAINAEDIKSFTAENSDNGKVIEKSTDSVLKLYALIDNYTAAISDTQATGSVEYRFVITDKAGKTITFEFYEDNLISVSDKRSQEATLTTYTVDNGDGLLKDIGIFLKE